MRHAAPPVSLELRPDPVFCTAAVLLPLAGLAVLALWAWEGRDDVAATPRLALAAAGTLLMLLSLRQAWRLARLQDLRMAAGPPDAPAAAVPAWRLAWTGAQWQLDPPGPTTSPPPADHTPAPAGRGSVPQPVSVEPVLDLDAWLLLRCRPLPDSPTPRLRPRTVCWLALSRGRHAASWHALRCALYSPRPRPTPPA